MDSLAGAPNDGRVDLCHFDGDARLGAPEGAGSGAGAFAAGPGHRGVAHGLGHGAVGAAVAAWPAVALIGSYELLMMIIRSAQVLEDAPIVPGLPDMDPLQAQAAEVFADYLAADRIPSVGAIRAQFHVGQSRAQRVRACLASMIGK